MTRMLKPMVFAAAILALIAVPVMALAQAQAPTAPPAGPGGGGLTAPETPMKSLPPQEKSIDGPVKKVDPASKTVQVGWGLGLFRTTLEVNDDTHIAVGGTKASLMDIREGDRVKAAYETREGKNIAKSIEVAPAGEKGKPMEGPGGLQKTPEAPKAPTPPQAQ